MANKIEKSIILFIEGILLSYGQIFFSKQKVVSVMLLAVSFFDWIAGVSGLIAVVVANLGAILLGFRKSYVSLGLYGFNALLVGLGMGVLYQPDAAFFLVLVFSSLFTLFLTIWLEGFFGKYGLPYLGWPFLLGIWMVSLAAKQFAALDMSERGIFMLNEIYRYGGIHMVKIYLWANELQIHESIKVYFKSLAAIFFQYHLLAGIVIAAALLIYSRIAFLLSLTGFFAAYFFYMFIGADITQLRYSYIGFNFILSAIAIGGFFIVPSRYSFLWVILLTPIISFVMISGSEFLGLVNLPVYALAYNIVVGIFLYILKFRERNFYFPELVAVQLASPELNLYSQKNYQSRFDVRVWTQMILPVIGEWTVTQGHQGDHTHKDDWRHAWDFEIMDDEGKNYSNLGYEAKDYYCFNKPVLAPADGIIQEIHDGIPDNAIGEMNLGNNWGNTIIIKHAERFYSKMSHLKNGSFLVKKGAYVKRGEILAHCGNSGRSSVPHLHFQVQADPFIGSKTIDYPFADYLVKKGSAYELKNYERPVKGEIVANVVRNESLHKAFNFIPGQLITFIVTDKEGRETRIEWEVKSDMYNYSFLECLACGAKAYFRNTGSLFYFTHFEGDKNSMLYYFYLGTYKVVLGYYNKLSIADAYPLNAFRKSLLLFLHDFAAPFYMFLKGVFILRYHRLEDDFTSSRIVMESSGRLDFMKKMLRKLDFEIIISNGRFEKFAVKSPQTNFQAKEIAS
jgi:urea transporter